MLLCTCMSYIHTPFSWLDKRLKGKIVHDVLIISRVILWVFYCKLLSVSTVQCTSLFEVVSDVVFLFILCDIPVPCSQIQIYSCRWSGLLLVQRWFVTAAVFPIVLPSFGTRIKPKLWQKHLLFIEDTLILQTTTPVHTRITTLLQSVSLLHCVTSKMLHLETLMWP